jgi:hypothetical protein
LFASNSLRLAQVQVLVQEQVLVLVVLEQVLVLEQVRVLEQVQAVVIVQGRELRQGQVQWLQEKWREPGLANLCHSLRKNLHRAHAVFHTLYKLALLPRGLPLLAPPSGWRPPSVSPIHHYTIQPIAK